MPVARARQRADDLQGRLKQRLEDLEAERRLAPLPPVVTGGALIVPAGLLASPPGADERLATERAALDAVMSAERALGRDPVRMPPGHAGYDIESRTADASLLFIAVKGRARRDLQRTHRRRAAAAGPGRGGPGRPPHGRRCSGSAGRDYPGPRPQPSGSAQPGPLTKRRETNVVRQQLAALPLTRLKETTQGRLRLGAIEAAGATAPSARPPPSGSPGSSGCPGSGRRPRSRS